MKSVNNFVDFEASIIPWLGKTSKMADCFLQEKLKEKGLDLSKEQVVVLKKLHEKDGLNQNELAFLTLRDKSTLTRLLSKMENKKYIQRIRSKEDKRISQVFLTEEGRNIYTKTTPVLRDLLDSLGKGITIEEKELTIRILKKVQVNMGVNADSL
ncbi:MarR family transcriptional regulator [uncultured Maribacter sp.]|uniref:MarR family winged helix-turn-helix transcriptional regulator n=1 Tax=uncultured Maribacter sp. TaxID=431308 RepID=UPI00261A78A7|nr:MarR family transcriptional regulator [uncultured Maribacter sp.]